MGFPGGTAVKNPPASAEDMGSIPGLERSPGEGNGSPRLMSGQVSRSSAGEYQADEQAVVPRFRWRVSRVPSALSTSNS